MMDQWRKLAVTSGESKWLSLALLSVGLVSCAVFFTRLQNGGDVSITCNCSTSQDKEPEVQAATTVTHQRILQSVSDTISEVCDNRQHQLQSIVSDESVNAFFRARISHMSDEMNACWPKCASDFPAPSGYPVDNDYLNFTLSHKDQVAYETKERAAIVVAIDLGSMHKYANHLASLNCYALLHDLPLYIEHFTLQSNLNVLRSRLRVFLKYLQHFQWVLAFDADTRVLNYSASVLDFLDDSADVILMERGPEVTSSHVAFRSTNFAVDFLKDWMTMGFNRPESLNAENGDLLEVLLSRLFPKEFAEDEDFAKDKRLSGWEVYRTRFAFRFHQLVFGQDMASYLPIKILRHTQSYLNHQTNALPGIFAHIKVTNLTEDELYCRASLRQWPADLGL
eukprot:TRINITY_DN7585_c1_g2_i7.p1 TRINITY_DN7585_c1_g2~~TRINITY_DN7585_c1_g2_i7.p1  ORF type:complete len:395 (-),score=17.33 TRINITY_DN7585_c1_g2_i7:347-1531(-)